MNFYAEQLKKLPVHTEDTWQGALVRMPSWVSGEDRKPYRPWMALWVSLKSDAIHGSEPKKPEEKNFALAINTLVDFACNKKLAGYLPGKIEVSDSALAEHLSGMLAEVGIEVQQRDKLLFLDSVLKNMESYMTDGKVVPGALAAKGVSLEMMRAFAQASCEFYQAQPWQYLSDEDLLEIEAPFVDAALRFVAVMGHGGQSYGLSFFRSQQQYESMEEQEPEKFWAQNEELWSITFDSITGVPLSDADMWEDVDLPVAGDEAYPFAASFGHKKKWRRPGPDILAFMEGLMLALAETSEEELDSGKWQKVVHTFKGPMEFKLVLPDLLEPVEKPVEGKVKIKGGIPDRRAMERETANLHRILEGHEFTSKEKLEEFLNKNFTGKRIPRQEPRNALEKAQDLVYQAFDAKGRRQLLLARKALEVSKDCADAYVLLAERTSDLQKSHDLYLEGILAGERTLGQEAFKKEAGRFWGLIETKPYMRARLGLAQCLEGMGEYAEAADHYREMLRLNPNDNQGARKLLLTCLLAGKQDEEVEALLTKYKGDKGMALWNYVKALVSFRRQGESQESRKCLRHALKVNRYVADFLLDEEEMPERLPGSYRLGSEEEAAICAERLMDVWQETPGAMEWLEKFAD